MKVVLNNRKQTMLHANVSCSVTKQNDIIESKLWFDMDDPKNSFRVVLGTEEIEWLIIKLEWMKEKMYNYDL